MTTSEARRHHLYERARESWDDEAAETLIESLPHPAADLATRADVADVRAEIANLRAEMHALIRSQTRWLISVILAGVGLIEAISRVG